MQDLKGRSRDDLLVIDGIFFCKHSHVILWKRKAGVNMTIGIVGGGALGLLFAGKLASAGIKVELAVRTDEQAQIINKQGIHILDEDVEQTAFVVCRAYDDVAYANQPLKVEWILLMVKQEHINEKLLKFLSKQSATIVCFQNGIGHMDKLLSVLPNHSLYCAITTEAGLKQSNRSVQHTGKGMTKVGNPFEINSLSSYFEKNLTKCFNNAGFHTILSKNINSVIWEKLLINAVVNPLTAILQVKNGDLLTSESWMAIMKNLYEEGITVAAAQGIQFSHDVWDSILQVCRNTAANYSSMLQDVIHHRRTEVDWINGSIIRLAQQEEIQVPTHQAVYQLVKGLEATK